MSRRIDLPSRTLRYAGAALACVLFEASVWAGSANTQTSGGLLAHDNLVPWEVKTGGKIGSSEERAEILKRLGFSQYAQLGKLAATSDVDVDREIEALKRQGITLTAWYFFSDDPGNDPQVRTALEAFKRHGVHPQIWISQPLGPYLSKKAEELGKLGLPTPTHSEDIRDFSEAEQERLLGAVNRLRAELPNYPRTPQEHEARLKRETDRIYALAKLVEPYGLNVQLYNHEGWFSLMDNQLAIIAGLKERQVTNVGIVYNFFHARDPLHDDTQDFASVWAKIQPHVAAVNISGVRDHRSECLYPSEGEDELEMMRTIERSGWKGPIGILAACFDRDPERGLKNILLGIAWMAAELKRPGSGGARPFPANSVPARRQP